MKADVELNPNECVKKLGSLIKDIKFAMVTTISNGELHSCPLTTQEAEFDGDLWFVISKSSQVAQNLRANEAVNISYASDKGVYVSVVGHGVLLEDRAKLEEFWSPAFKVWFKQGIDDPEIQLLKIHVTSAEYWESPSLTVTRLAAFAKALVTGKSDSVGEHRKLNLN